MKTTKNTSKSESLYQTITNDIVEQLETGTIPWEASWIFDGFNPAYNRESQKNYGIINQLILGEGGEWATYNQWARSGAMVKRGSKAKKIIYYNVTARNVKDKESGEEHTEYIPTIRYSNVFSINSVDPIFEDKPITPVKEPMVYPEDMNERYAVIEKVIADYMDREGIKFQETGTEGPAYDWEENTINVPKEFKLGPETYREVLCELIHSTGHKDRLNRLVIEAEYHTRLLEAEMKNHQVKAKLNVDEDAAITDGTSAYHMERLVVAIGAAFLMAYAGIKVTSEYDENFKQINTWIKMMKKDPKMFVHAAKAADKAYKFIFAVTDYSEKEESETPTVKAEEAKQSETSEEKVEVVKEEPKKKTTRRKTAAPATKEKTSKKAAPKPRKKRTVAETVAPAA